MPGNNVPGRRRSPFGTLCIDTAFHKAMFFAYHTEGGEVQGHFKSIQQLKMKVHFLLLTLAFEYK